jgi:hypothetical protein
MSLLHLMLAVEAAIMEAQRRDTEREIRRLIGSSAGPLSDEMERRIDRHLMRNSSFLPP